MNLPAEGYSCGPLPSNYHLVRQSHGMATATPLAARSARCVPPSAREPRRRRGISARRSGLLRGPCWTRATQVQAAAGLYPAAPQNSRLCTGSCHRKECPGVDADRRIFCVGCPENGHCASKIGGRDNQKRGSSPGGRITASPGRSANSAARSTSASRACSGNVWNWIWAPPPNSTR